MKIDSEIKNIIKICTRNIKGLTRAKEIENLLPIEADNLIIKKEEGKIVIYKEQKILGGIWKEFECYSNLAILKIITKEYGLEAEGESIIQLIKYKYMIDNIMMK